MVERKDPFAGGRSSLRTLLIAVLASLVLVSLGVSWALAQPGGLLGKRVERVGKVRPKAKAVVSRSRLGLSDRFVVDYTRRLRPPKYRDPSPPVDETAPQTTITAQPPATTTSTSASFSFSSSESGSTFACKLDAGSWSSCASPKPYGSLSAGGHIYSVRATDGAGNTDPTPATDTWTVQPPADETPPETTITAQPPANTTSTSASFSFSASESGSSFACKLDKGSWAACTSPKAYSSLSVGEHTFSVRATDAAANADPSPASWSWVVAMPPPPPPVDETAPQTTITAQPPATTTSSSASFSFSSSESNSTFACMLDAGPWSSCTSPKAYSSLSVGEHTFSVRATDGASNTDPTPASWSWEVDLPPPPPPADETPPETTITANPAASTTSTSASFSFSASEPGSTFACKLDAGSWVACTSPKPYSSLSVSTHTFSVRATDNAANVDPTPATYTWSVQAPPPPPPPGGPCDQVLNSVSSAQSALTSAATGSVICLADGSYGSLSLSMKRPAPGVTLRAQNPGAATIGGVSASGAGVTVERFSSGSFSVNAGAERIAFLHNSAPGITIVGSSSAYAKSIDVIGNEFSGRTGSGEKDTMMLQRFEGLRIEDNEIWIADEDGNHNDGLQTVWGGRGLIFRQNWMRGGAGSQGFFIKDGEVSNVSFEDNLIAGRPSKAPWAGAPLQFYDTVPNAAHPFYTGYGIVIRHNTIWSNPNTSYVRECQNQAILVELNVMDGWNAPDDLSCVLSQLTQDYNVITGGSIGKRGAHDVSTQPSFLASSSQDWQLTASSSGNFPVGRAGVTWRPADRSYGP